MARGPRGHPRCCGRAGKTEETEAQRPAEQHRRCTPLLTHNFSKLPPPFPAVHGLTMQGSNILGDFTPAAFPWAAHSSCCPASQPGSSPAAGLCGLKGLFLSRPVSAGTILLPQLPGPSQSRLHTARLCPPVSRASLPGAASIVSPVPHWV